MTLEEAQKIARVISMADGGCSHCVRSLCDRLNDENLGFKFYADHISGDWAWFMNEPDAWREAYPGKPDPACPVTVEIC